MDLQPRRRSNRRAPAPGEAGFSLIELFTIVAIIGFLASVAVPTYDRVKNKSKLAERDMMIRSIELSISEYLAAHDEFPNGGGGSSFLFGDWNPPWPPLATKRSFIPAITDWHYLTFSPQGPVFCSYQVFAFQSAASTYFYVYAATDLDSDGDVGWRYKEWTLGRGGWDLTVDTNWGGI